MTSDAWLAAYELVQRYAHFYDAGSIDELRDMFTEDSLFESLPRKKRSEHFPFPAEGREAIVTALGTRFAYWTATVDRIHAMVNFVVREAAADSVQTTSQLLVFHDEKGAAPKLVLTGHYDDTIVCEDDGKWRFSERLLYRHNEVAAAGH